jgi:ABC-type uncharacterized transport system substrate-binding protein
MPIQYNEDNKIAVNLDTAKTLGIEIPSEILENASILIENGEVTEK